MVSTLDKGAIIIDISIALQMLDLNQMAIELRGYFRPSVLNDDRENKLITDLNKQGTKELEPTIPG